MPRSTTEMRAIKMPHLPEGRVGLLALGERYASMLAAPLAALGIEPLWLPELEGVDKRIASHADLALLHLGGGRLVAARGSNIVKCLTNRGFKVFTSDNAPSEGYPTDCILCGCVAGNCFIHNTAITDTAALRLLASSDTDININIDVINVSQGYAKCAVCVVDEHSIITSDAGIEKAAAAHGMETLLISQGFVELAGFEYGFLGGASFKLSRGVLAFTGRLEAHPDKARIIAFLRERHIEAVYLTDRPLFDIGSAIPLLEA